MRFSLICTDPNHDDLRGPSLLFPEWPEELTTDAPNVRSVVEGMKWHFKQVNTGHKQLVVQGRCPICRVEKMLVKGWRY